MPNESAPRTIAEFQARWWEVIEAIEERRAREARKQESTPQREEAS